MVGSGFHRWGFSDNVVVGFSVQATRFGQYGGPLVTLNTPASVLDFSHVAGHGVSPGWGHAERLQYRYYIGRDSLLRHGILAFAVTHTSDNYAALAPYTKPMPSGESWSFYAGYSQLITDRISAAIGFGQQLRDGHMWLRTLSFTLSPRWRHVTFDFTIEHNIDPASSSEWAGYFSMHLRFARGVTALASHDTARCTSRMEFHYTPPRNISSLGGSVGLLGSEETTGL
ncbi:MAG: hypothetical protein N3G20_02810 [Verrucomicrobiae bacterium]|nr:hypothetical protein [Verrucomicrobiae bacterium]